MLAIDIETLGLLTDKGPLPPISCVCLYDGHAEHTLVFFKVSVDQTEQNKQRLLGLLDAAESLVGFNAVLFDLEYIKRFFGLPQAQLSAWIKKTIDPFMAMKWLLQRTCSLKHLLAMNGLPSKSGSGLEAILWARQGRMDLVTEYCMMDTKLVYMACTLPSLRLTDTWTATLQDGMWILKREPFPVPTLHEALLMPKDGMMFHADHMALKSLVAWENKSSCF